MAIACRVKAEIADEIAALVLQHEWAFQPLRGLSGASPRPSGAAHHPEHRSQAQASLPGERCRLQKCALLVTGAGKTDPDFMAPEDRVLPFGRGVFLIEDLALPAAVFRTVAAEIVEKRVTAEDVAVIEQHHTGEATLDAVEHMHANGIEAVDDAPLPDAAGDRQRLLLDRGHDRAEER